MEENITETEHTKSVADMTAGEMLRNARTTGRRKREIQTIAKLLCIKEEFLQALEDGNYTVLPEVVYILGFARNYAMELGLDPNEVVRKIKRELGLVGECRVSTDDIARVSRKTEGASCKITREPKATKSFKMPEIVPMLKSAWAFVVRNWKWFAAIAGGILLLVALVLVLVFSGSSETTPETPVAEETVIAPEEPSEPAYTMPVRERLGLENRDKATIILQANKNAGDVGTWVQIEDARGKKAFSKIMFPGDIFYMPDGTGYKGTFGNVAGIDFWVNGELAPTVKASRNAKVAISAESLIKPAAAQQ